LLAQEKLADAGLNFVAIEKLLQSASQHPIPVERLDRNIDAANGLNEFEKG